MTTTYPTQLEGTILATTIPPFRLLVSRKERWHLAKMASGEYALVQSWETQGDWEHWKRVYNVINRLGSGDDIQPFLDRFDRWVDTGE